MRAVLPIRKKRITFLLTLSTFLLLNFLNISTFAQDIPVGTKKTKVFGNEGENTALSLRIIDDNLRGMPGKRVIISNRTLADTLLTNSSGVARFRNSAVTNVSEMGSNRNNSGKVTTAESPQVASEKFTMYAYYGKEISESNGSIIGEGKIYTITGEEVARLPIVVNNNIAIMHFDAKNICNAVYIYSMETKYGIGSGKILKSNFEVKGSFNSINSDILKKLEVYNYNNQKNEKLNKTNTITDVFVTIESLPGDFRQIETIKDTIEVPLGEWTRKNYRANEIIRGKTYTIIARDLNSNEVIPNKEIFIGSENHATTNENGMATLPEIHEGSWGIGVTPSETYYGFNGALFVIPQPTNFEELKDTLTVYLWNKERPLPGTNETRKPTLYEIKEMAAGAVNLQRALGIEVHNLDVTGEQLELGKKFYAYVDSMVFNKEWGITLKTNEPFDYKNHNALLFSFDNIENFWYNVITDGKNETETGGSGDIYVARAPLQNYVTVGQAHIFNFQEDPTIDPAIGKEIVFRLGEYNNVGSRASIGEGSGPWFTETDRVLLYSYLKHDRATLTNDKVIYYTTYHMTE